MSARTPVALLVIAAVLLTYVWLFERGRPGRTEIEARTGLRVEKLVRDRITRIRIASGMPRRPRKKTCNAKGTCGFTLVFCP